MANGRASVDIGACMAYSSTRNLPKKSDSLHRRRCVVCLTTHFRALISLTICRITAKLPDKLLIGHLLLTLETLEKMLKYN